MGSFAGKTPHRNGCEVMKPTGSVIIANESFYSAGRFGSKHSLNSGDRTSFVLDERLKNNIYFRFLVLPLPDAPDIQHLICEPQNPLWGVGGSQSLQPFKRVSR